MNRLRVFFTIILAIMLNVIVNAQDVRTIETKVADLLARLPAENRELTMQLMEQMYSLGDEGMDMICRQVVPAGTGDDTKARYAVSSLTVYISGDKDDVRKKVWENQCLKFLREADNREVKSFFIRQLDLVGSDDAVKVLKDYVISDDICDDAVMALQSVGSDAAYEVLAGALVTDHCPCASQILVALAEGRYAPALDSYIEWSIKGSEAERSAALYAMASAGDAKAAQYLIDAAAKAGYKWDPTGAVRSLLLYARNIGLAGNIKEMERITGLVISSCSDPATASQRLAAMDVITEVKGNGALNMLLDAADDPDVAIRGGALRLAVSIPGSDITKKWINRYGKVSQEAKPGILFMLGERSDATAIPLMLKELNNQSSAISDEAAAALAKLDGKQAVDPLLKWIVDNNNEEDHRAAANALTTILDSTNTEKVAELLPASSGHSAVTLIWLLAWSGDNKYFNTVCSLTGSSDIAVRAAAISSLAALAGYDDQTEIITMMEKTAEKAETEELQNALVSAAMKDNDPETRADIILKAMDKGADKMKLIPALARIGGKEALKRVTYEFENGDAQMRDICFEALSYWPDQTALPSLLNICASGNKTFGVPAFDAYMRMTSLARMTPEQKLLKVKEIAPYAASSDSKIDMITFAATLNIYPARFFICTYLSDQSDDVSRVASEANESMNLPDDKVFEKLFNGTDLTGWKGLVGNPLTRAAMKPEELAARQKEADREMAENWSVKDGLICFSGTGNNMCSVKEYGDFELYIDWRICKEGDSGIYLRGSPQVQIWDPTGADESTKVGSGGLYNNQTNQSAPLKVADNPPGEWNTYHIIMVGNRVSVWLNGELVTDNVIMENYWDRNIPIFEKGPVELQAHGNELNFRDIYIREIEPAGYRLTDKEKEEGYVSLFNGGNLDGWVGDTISYTADSGMIVINPGNDSGGNLYTEKEYSDFVFRFEFQLTPGANNGLGIRTPTEGDAAYVGMEIQILDNTDAIYANLKPYQYHGSVYGVIPARRGFLRPVGEWNYEEVTAQGTKIKVVLNGTVIVNGDIAEASKKGTMDGKEHPGLLNSKGHIGFLGHGSIVRFRNIRIREL